MAQIPEISAPSASASTSSVPVAASDPSPDDLTDMSVLLPLKRKPDNEPQRAHDAHPSQRPTNKVYILRCVTKQNATSPEESTIEGVFQDMWTANTALFNYSEFSDLVEGARGTQPDIDISIDQNGENATTSFEPEDINHASMTLTVEEHDFDVAVGSQQAALAAKSYLDSLVEELEEESEEESDNPDDDDHRLDYWDRDPYAEDEEEEEEEEENDEDDSDSEDESDSDSSVQVIE